MAAALLHDIGKTREFTYGAEFGISDEGAMLGHLAIGAELISGPARRLPDEMRLALLHCVLSHHGPEAAEVSVVAAAGARRAEQLGGGRLRRRHGLDDAAEARVVDLGDEVLEEAL